MGMNSRGKAPVGNKERNKRKLKLTKLGNSKEMLIWTIFKYIMLKSSDGCNNKVETNCNFQKS